MSCRARAADRNRPAPRAARRARGFSLTELMITLAIIAILASIALPSYRNYVIRSHRGDATQALTLIKSLPEFRKTLANLEQRLDAIDGKVNGRGKS